MNSGWGPDLWWGLFPIPFLLIGIGMGLGMMGVFGSSRKRRRRVHDPDELHRLDDLDEPDDDADDTMADVVPGRITPGRARLAP